MTRLDRDAVFWSHSEDCELLLSDTPEQAAEVAIDDECECLTDSDILTVHEYKRMLIDKKSLAKDIEELIEDRFDELYRDDGGEPSITNEVLIGIGSLCDVIQREMPSYWCQTTGAKISKTVAEWKAVE